MHIKAVVFRDFKSYYYDGLGGEEFSPLVNCLVGGNGSGKSNFFAGVQFVLGHGKYRTIPVKERKELLHEGAGNKRLSTSVELHLDNSDGRLALDSDSNTVVIQRMLGSKKDEYIVNQRSTSASEVHALLEAAGFSPSNPYNIVEQGRITAFATMRDEDRFELLKQIAGTKVYEDRRLQSLQVLEQAERDMARIDSNIQNIDGRLNELGEEREEFKAHQQLERRHRCLQYCIHKKEADTAMAALKEAEETLASQTNSAQALMDKIHETSKDLKALEKKAAQASLTVQQQKRQRDLILQERSGWVKRQARLEVSLNAAETEQKEDQLLKAKTEQSLAAVLAEIRKKDAQLEKEARELNELETVAEKSRAEVANLAAQVDFLITKRGRHNQFSTRVDRDKWLTTEVAKQQKTLAVYEKEKEKLEATKVDIPKRVAAILHEIEKKRSTLSIEAATFEKRKDQISKLVKERDTLAERRRALFRSQTGIQQEMDSCSERLSSWQQRLDKTCPRDIRAGLQSVQQVLKEEKISGVYGPVIDLFSTNKELFTAADVMAGTSLFHVVVENNEVASKILRAINQKKLPGRPSFYPLNRLNAKPKSLPTTDDCFPLYSKLTFEDKFAPVMADLYGRVLVCTDLKAASAHSKTHNCDSVLVNGDKVDARGGISGGFLDVKVSRIAAATEVRNARAEKENLQKKLDGVLKECAALDQKMNDRRSTLQTTEDEAERFNRERERVSYDVRAFELEVTTLKDVERSTAKSLQSQERYVEEYRRSIAAMELEKAQPMAEKLSAAEAAELNDKQKRLDDLKKQLGTHSSEAEACRARVASVRQLLSENLLKRKAEFEERLAKISVHKGAVLDEKTQHESDIIKTRIKNLEAELTECEKISDAAVETRTKALEAAEKKRQVIAKMHTITSQERTNLDDKKRAQILHHNKYEQATEQIRKLGPLPSGVEEYSSLSAKEIEAQLRDTRSKLKTLSHVNKKAYDQYAQLAETKETLDAQRKAREDERKTVTRLITDLDAKKDEAVLRTFKQVKAGFAKNFKDLVGHEGASAELVLVRNAEAAGRKATRVDEFNSVSVKVNFGVGGGVGGSGNKDISRLSGGQKSVVALALIFSIQQCDPAPFYIFDEIDAALDAEYRFNVARKIQELSKTAQFLVVSFKPEMIDIANRHFVISFKNKVSNIRRCTAQDAHKVLQMAASSGSKKKRPREEDEEEAER